MERWQNAVNPGGEGVGPTSLTGRARTVSSTTSVIESECNLRVNKMKTYQFGAIPDLRDFFNLARTQKGGL